MTKQRCKQACRYPLSATSSKHLTAYPPTLQHSHLLSSCYRAAATAQAAVTAALASNPATTDSVTSESAAAAAAADNAKVQILSVTQAPPGVPSQALIELPAGLSHARILRSLKRSAKVCDA